MIQRWLGKNLTCNGSTGSGSISELGRNRHDQACMELCCQGYRNCHRRSITTKVLEAHKVFEHTQELMQGFSDTNITTVEDKHPSVLWVQNAKLALTRWVHILLQQPRRAIVNIPEAKVLRFYRAVSLPASKFAT